MPTRAMVAHVAASIYLLYCSFSHNLASKVLKNSIFNPGSILRSVLVCFGVKPEDKTRNRRIHECGTMQNATGSNVSATYTSPHISWRLSKKLYRSVTSYVMSDILGFSSLSLCSYILTIASMASPTDGKSMYDLVYTRRILKHTVTVTDIAREKGQQNNICSTI